MSKDAMSAKREYLRQKVDPLIQSLLVGLMKDQPSDVVDYCLKWFQDQKGSKGGAGTTNVSKPAVAARKGSHSSSSKSEDDEYVDVKALREKHAKKLEKPRTSVSAEVYGRFNQKKAYVPKVVPKTEEQKQKIRKRLGQAFMFSALDEKEKTIVVDAMEVKEFKAGETVIKQKDSGDVLYVVDQGKLDCFKLFEGESKEKWLKQYEPGESFGELALLYNAPRAASIKAKEACVLFSLDRECFNSIVKESTVNKRNKYMEFLGKIDLFNHLDNYEKSKICDCLIPTTYKPGEYVIRQGEVGDTFYLVVEGRAYAAKKNEKGQEEQVFEYNDSGYFGELSLLRDQPRAASVIAKVNYGLLDSSDCCIY